MVKRIICALLTVTLFVGCTSDADIPIISRFINVQEVEEPEEVEILPPIVDREILPRSGGTLNLSIRHPATLNPLLNTDDNIAMMLNLIFEPLARLDEQHRIVPNLLESMEMSDDGLRMIATLRNNIRWHDGTEITSSDIAYSIDVLRQADDSVIHKHSIANISGHRIVDSRTIEIDFTHESITNKYSLLFPIIPRHHFEVGGNTAMNPLGSGFYRVEEYVIANRLVLASTTNAFNENAYIDRIVIYIIPDSHTDASAFEQSVIDALAMEMLARGGSAPISNISINEYPTMYYEFIGFNFENELFSHLDVRVAISSAVSVENLITEVYVGHALMAHSPINPVSWWYESDTIKPRMTMDQARVVINHFRAVELDEENQADESYENDTSNKLIIITNEDNVERVKSAGILMSSLEQIGLPSIVEAVPFEEFHYRLIEGNFDLFVGGFNLAPVPDLRFAFHSEGEANFFRFSDSLMDTLLEEVYRSHSESDILMSLSNFQRYFVSMQPNISIGFRKRALLTSERVRGNIDPNFMNIYSSIGEWFIYEE